MMKVRGVTWVNQGKIGNRDTWLILFSILDQHCRRLPSIARKLDNIAVFAWRKVAAAPQHKFQERWSVKSARWSSKPLVWPFQAPGRWVKAYSGLMMETRSRLILVGAMIKKERRTDSNSRHQWTTTGFRNKNQTKCAMHHILSAESCLTKPWRS